MVDQSEKNTCGMLRKQKNNMQRYDSFINQFRTSSRHYFEIFLAYTHAHARTSKWR